MNQTRFWALLGLAAGVTAVVAYLFFPLAFSILSLEVSMDRERALREAVALVVREGLGPGDPQQAASFGLDTETQTFVELEGGGKDAFTQMLDDGFYSPYAWRVRHFREGEKREVTIRFAPDGGLQGFVEEMPEDAPGPALEAEAARAIAEAGAASTWQVDLTGYTLVEQAQETRPGGRVDHTFTYERATPTLGAGRYRLRLGVSGDRLTRVVRYVFIPEAFTRRFAEMRSANDAIGVASVVGLALLYVFGGIGVGLFVLLRQRALIARPAIVWGVVIAGMQALQTFNVWPLAWMGYDTALPRSSFVAQQIAIAVGSFVGFSAFFALSFMVAEGLTRRAFGDHPQFWRVWSKDAGRSTAVLGRTVAGYLLVPIFLAYEVGLYLFATRVLGWWTPAETLLQPDALAAYVPWFQAIAASLQAGFWEECLFRAVPLAGAALLGDRFGKRGLFIAIAFVVQAVIFGAGHAPYPTQPSFARPVELLLPSFAFGLLYLRFGLVPAIVLHFVFDVVWFALPIFSATAPGIWLQQLLLVVVTLVPLWVVLWRRWQGGAWTALDPSLRNAAWRPALQTAVDDAEELAVGAPVRVPMRLWLVLGGISLVAVAVAALQARTPTTFTVDREDAAAIARSALEARGVTLGPAWETMPVPSSGAEAPHEFVSRTAGESRRRELLGTYLAAPGWRVRFATFEGDVADRAEEWSVNVSATGVVGLIRHVLPQGRAGATLDEAAARDLAFAAVRDRTGLDVAAGDAREIEARPRKLDARTDWVFTFVDARTSPLPQGELRVRVDISGDEVASTGRLVHVPEEWSRRERAEGTRNAILGFFAAFVFGSLFVAAAGSAVLSWSRRRYAPWIFVAAAGLMLLVSGLNAANGWPATKAMLDTAQPLALQLAALAGVGLVALTLLAVVVGLPLGAAPPQLTEASRLPAGRARALGVAVGLTAAGVGALAVWLQTPPWGRFPDVGALGTFVPAAHLALGPVGGFLTRLAFLTAVLVGIDRYGRGWQRHRALVISALAVLAWLSIGPPGGAGLVAYALAGTVTAAAFVFAYLLALRADLTMIPIALGTMMAVSIVGGSLSLPFPMATVGSVLGAALVGGLAWIAHGWLRGRPLGSEGPA